MHARVNTIFGRRDKVAAGLALAEGTDRAAVEASFGNLGLATFADPDAGVIVAVSYWNEPARASAPTLTAARAAVAAAAGGDLVAESYAVAWQLPATASPGATVRVDRLQIDTATAGAGLRERLVRHVRHVPGFCGAELLVDRALGAGMLVTTWTSDSDAQRVDAAISAVRDGGTTTTETYVLVRGRAGQDR
ncbi:hypothetical protein ACQEVB_14890 [Pseudonocardia sp. CA-107938]|uniref:hypothetical protein n=1 Tax=Pseudonocardia sp. CA-107938 TaxID=3240021 RepID=UPI003D906AA6